MLAAATSTQHNPFFWDHLSYIAIKSYVLQEKKLSLNNLKHIKQQ